MFAFFDTETTGLPINWKAPMSDLDNWPRVIQLAWTTADENGVIISTNEILIKPDGWVVPVEKFWIEHGFSTEKCEADGIPLPEAIGQFAADLSVCEYLVSHNMDYDYNVLGAEFIRYQLSAKRLTRICTKEASTDFCKIPFGGERAYLSRVQKRYKWPTLGELHQKLFGKEMENAHQAGGDVKALAACFFELKRLRVIQLPQKSA